MSSTELKENVDWCALTYCWGGQQPVTTTCSTLANHLVEINIHQLPPTLQDAVAVCRGLGVQFLWIDSLCIVQDDELDMRRELSHMAQIYELALVVISASRAANVHEGFLKDAPMSYTDRDIRPVTLRLEDNMGIQSNLILRDSRPAWHWMKELMDEEPIHKRGWTFQEAILATRKIEYKTEGIGYSCRTLAIDGSRKKNIVGRGHFKSSDHVPLEWGLVVEAYTRRKISLSSDKLVAIGAVAAFLQRSNHKTYVAGLWKEDLSIGLCWHTLSWELAARPKKWRAPSWSWAAYDGECVFSE